MIVVKNLRKIKAIKFNAPREPCKTIALFDFSGLFDSNFQ